mgnify:CR=1 FL=1
MAVRAKGSFRNDERFSTVSPTRVPRSAFDRSHSHKTTFNTGQLVPISVDELLPGDTYSWRPSFLARLTSPQFPFMDGLHLDYQAFVIPVRLVMDNFTKLMGERENPADHNDYELPTMTAPAGGFGEGSVADYLGVPPRIGSLEITSIYHRAYNLCVREWYRDANLSDAPVVDTDDGPDDYTDYPLATRSKRKDYFSGALPFLQRGDAVQLPIGSSAPVVESAPNAYPTYKVPALGQTGLGMSSQVTTGDVTVTVGGAGSPRWLEWDATNLIADLSSATASTINEIRTALATQHLLERDARGGGRYRELMLSHFGVVTDDIRLMRPQLVATGSFPINVTAVESTANVSGWPVGELGAYATGMHVGRTAMFSATEHMIFLGICSVRADLTYQQGVHRMFNRRSRYDFYWPDFQGLGEQIVESREIYADGTGDPALGTGDYSVWGYQPRYEEYRHRYSYVSGDFRSDATTPLDVWHLALDFGSRPTLDDAFILEDVPIDRVLTVSETFAPSIKCDAFFKVNHVRPMGRFGVPGLTRF